MVALGVSLCGSTACHEKTGGTQADAGAQPSGALTPEMSAKVLAKVGDHTITLGDYAAAIEHMDNFERLRFQSPERRKELLTEMINVELLAHEAEAKGYDKEPAAQQEVRAILRDSMLKEARKGAPAPASIPDADVRAYFEAHRADYKDPERRRASVIVLKDEAAAKDVLDQARKGASAAQPSLPGQWGELVRARSIEAQAKADVPTDLAGDVGMMSPPGDPRGENKRVPEEVRAALFEIPNVNDVLPRVVKGADGKYYVVRLTQKSDARERTLQEAERSIRVKLAQDRMKAKEDELVAELRAKYPVRIDEAVLVTVKVDVADAGGAAAPHDAGPAGRDQ